MKKKRKKYVKGAFPNTVFNTENGNLYVRKSVSGGDGKQRQIWRVCQPPTRERAAEILAEIETEIEAARISNNVESMELARFFVRVRAGQISFSEFKKALKTIEK